MNSEEWHKRIAQSAKDAGTYKPYFEDVIATLAGILENRDRAQEQFDGKPIIEHTDQRGHKNMVKNPALVIINECNAQALTFWKELGLTAKAFQAMQNNGFKKAETSFEDVLKNIGI